MSSIALMSEPDAYVALQMPVRKQTRQRLKKAAAGTDLTMAELGDILLEYGSMLLESGKLPAALAAAIEKKEAEKEAAGG